MLLLALLPDALAGNFIPAETSLLDRGVSLLGIGVMTIVAIIELYRRTGQEQRRRAFERQVSGG